jgi:hypothetical protein
MRLIVSNPCQECVSDGETVAVAVVVVGPPTGPRTVRWVLSGKPLDSRFLSEFLARVLRAPADNPWVEVEPINFDTEAAINAALAKSSRGKVGP